MADVSVATAVVTVIAFAVTTNRAEVMTAQAGGAGGRDQPTSRVKRKENPARGGVEKVAAGGGRDGRGCTLTLVILRNSGREFHLREGTADSHGNAANSLRDVSADQAGLAIIVGVPR